MLPYGTQEFRQEKIIKTLVQCDFDGTITERDTSFFLLDAFGQGDWRRLLRDYKEHRISVGAFNTRAFAMVQADEATLLRMVKGRVKMRGGFRELAGCCSRRGFQLVIVSNGLEFYINALLEDIGLGGLEIHAAKAWFCPQGMKVQYVGPDGEPVDDGLKEAYTKSFLSQGYRVIYVGNGDSDIIPAKYADKVFARGELLAYCRDNNMECSAFDDLTDVVQALEFL
ncbi:MAG: MtnX-like HAD-IB family phosphatase [Chloroflexota bacterium]|nr:MtnX-like HAD-IB family phosphatase [Chloroflexota bacterium]